MKKNKKNTKTKSKRYRTKSKKRMPPPSYYKKRNTVLVEDFDSQNGGAKKCMCMDYDVDSNNKMHIMKNVSGKKCTRVAKPDSDFCSKHQNCVAFFKKFLSGYEPSYEPNDWNDNHHLKNSHNCYSYFADLKVKAIEEKCKKLCKNKANCPHKTSTCSKLKPQPGDLAHLSRHKTLKNKNREYTCKSMEEKIMKDNSSLKKVKFTKKCPKGSFKGAMVVDPHHTFHFYRQDNTGLWSHKPGVLKVKNTDAVGNLIYMPHYANRNYKKYDKNSDINYSNFCGYYCVPDKDHVDLHMI